MITSTIFYIGVDTSDFLDPKISLDMCYTYTIPEELLDIEDMVAMMSMDCDKEEAMEAIMEQYPIIMEIKRMGSGMEMRSRFHSNLQGPFKVTLPNEVNNDQGREIIENLIAAKSKEELTAFLKSCKISKYKRAIR